MKLIFTFFLALFMSACSTKTNPEIIFKDIEGYNLSVLKLKVNNCIFIDSDASCANKSESYVVECRGSDCWYKWDKSKSMNGEWVISVCTIPKNFKEYHCNPWLATKKEFKAYRKQENDWVAENYSE